MGGYFIFIFVMSILVLLGEYTRKKGFEKLTVRRECDTNPIYEGEEIKITTIVENNKWLPISFLLIREKMPLNVQCLYDDSSFSKEKHSYHVGRYRILWHERVKRTYKIKIAKRGVYALRELYLTLGDPLGFSSENREMEDHLEILVYPKIIHIKKFEFQSTSLQGEIIINRWMYKDPLYIKGIREYNIEDRMKDIHWKSSLRMNKLMVKEYDYTCEKEIVMIQNVQCGENHWACIDEIAIENSIKITVSLIAKAIREGVPAGIWTNAQIISYYKYPDTEVKPSLNAFKNILELCARIDYSTRIEFDTYLKEKSKDFTRSCTYIIITPFLNKETTYIISKLKRAGFLIKIIDVSTKQNLPSIEGVEQVRYAGEGA